MDPTQPHEHITLSVVIPGASRTRWDRFLRQFVRALHEDVGGAMGSGSGPVSCADAQEFNDLRSELVWRAQSNDYKDRHPVAKHEIHEYVELKPPARRSRAKTTPSRAPVGS
ncbi:MAG: hypothetical protein ACKVVT_15105 [Dehalococcoidia bacterium]